ncbi:SurA N-terminal domain-containing protein [Verminephrobacter eiseniae]|uniref:Periplasmic chaperone PpiD n=1 Tax=Verminephrobacter eiseniae (strain EF01-2) TaxID=391735 RepID=A1WLD1_VEREI|nr:SurA N-terminal domain-containing protein [Verminephrobacter eiseniae]ABM58438.1 PpiC-type peptidyl-prolyl cis-trans isomerase [Verminephrobacter eiseniae EF01-2]MCW5284014.1 peptidyl-prolyl cis-trans isomerase [Verminephrobacter eiseniae]MCW5301722.1 peptidyl-prolyl cis-trans isomerase [Verminephrobacter eiseniae]MCW8181726.1 peptidyl-prolyl cis-trans isomerase [Verminephrobacter eiseniae]MCW8189576.1 peptidyl-prolyl cis-trans isomerase [Verminephrobacter eiseniae]
MFETIRKHSKIVMIFLFLLIIPAFVLVGTDRNYFSEASPVVARVDGHDISQADWDRAHRQESDRIRAQSPTVDARLLDSPLARYATLERLVRERVLDAAAQQMRLVTSDARLIRSLQETPAIAALKRADGTLDADAYRALLVGQGVTPEVFEANLRRNIAADQVLDAVLSTALVANAQARLALDALYERRDIQVARFDAPDFAGRVLPTDADLQSYYDAHPAQFRQPEQATVEYLVLDLDSVRATITVPEDELRSYYDSDYLPRIMAKQERRASHILISVAKDAPAAEREKAKARATELLAQLRKTPADFAPLAKQSSDDKGSAAAGGDLNFFARGAMTKPFEEAVFALKKGQISDVVETEFGYHIIELTDIKTPPQPGFEEARAVIAAELGQQRAQRQFAEMAESFSNAVYEQADSLLPVADKLKLKLQSATNVSRTPAPGAKGALASSKFLQALFAPDTLQNKRNTEAVEIGPQQMAAGRVTSYTPASTLPLAQVRERVRSLYVAEKSAALAQQEGQAKLSAWKADPATATGLAAATEIARGQGQNLPRPVIDAALRTPADALPAWTGVDLGAAGYAVVKINRVLARQAPDAQRAQQEQQQYAQWLARAEVLAYYELLKQRLKVRIQAPRPQVAAPEIAEN